MPAMCCAQEPARCPPAPHRPRATRASALFRALRTYGSCRLLLPPIRGPALAFGRRGRKLEGVRAQMAESFLDAHNGSLWNWPSQCVFVGDGDSASPTRPPASPLRCRFPASSSAVYYWLMPVSLLRRCLPATASAEVAAHLAPARCSVR